MTPRSLLLSALVCALPLAKAADAPADLDAGFTRPSAQYRPMVWWHWMNGSVTKEGIRADLAAMKAAGLAGAQVLDIAPGFTKPTMFPGGPVRYGSDAWHDRVQYAIRTAAEMGLKFGIMNEAGWSESGGPWVPVEDSMKKITWSEVTVEGGQPVRRSLPVPASNLGFYRDIAVVAVPADAVTQAQPAVNSSLDGVSSAEGISFAKGTDSPTFTFDFGQAVECRLFEMRIPFQRGAEIRLNGVIEASEDGQTYRAVRPFGFPGHLLAHKGFIGSELILTTPFRTTRARFFRASFKGLVSPLALASLRFSDAYRIENFQSKSLDGTLGGAWPTPPEQMDDAAAIPSDRVIPVPLSADGAVDWNAPAGRWALLRIGYTTTGLPNHPAQDEGTGFEVDKMDPATLDRHFGHALGRILREAKPYLGTTFTSILLDSWEAGQQNWTPRFPQEFKALRGYDLSSFLPVLTGRVVRSAADSEAFLRDFRVTISELIGQNYYGELTRLARAHGLHFYGEPYGGKAYNDFEAAEHVDVDMGEFWYYRDRSRLSVAQIKDDASVVHVQGKNILAAESFTAAQTEAGWFATPYLLKPVGDLAFQAGLNQVFLHSFTHQPYSALAPGFTIGSSGSNFGRLVTWWPRAGAWVDYLARCQYLLRQGEFVGDILYLRNDDAGNFVPDRYPPIPAGYDCDYAIADEIADATAEAGMMRSSGGAQYRAVVLPAKWLGELPLLRKLRSLAEAGVIVVGPAPSGPAGRQDLLNLREWRQTVDALWGGSEPRVRPAGELASLLDAAGVGPPDCAITAAGAGGPVRYLHRRSGSADIYFLSTRGSARVDFRADFREDGRIPEIFDPVTGQITEAPVFSIEGGRTAINLSLGDAGSLFVVFRRPLPARWISSLTTGDGEPVYLGRQIAFSVDGVVRACESGTYRAVMDDGRSFDSAVPVAPAPMTLSGPWQVEFRARSGAPFQRSFPQLVSWTEKGDDVLRYFSGTGTYRAEWEIPAEALAGAGEWRLDLGEVHDLAFVRINGQPVGTLWMPPFAADVTRYLHAGRNTIEIEVTNRWINRLMGDQRLPSDMLYQNRPKNGPGWGLAVQTFPDWVQRNGEGRPGKRTTFATFMPNYRPTDIPPTSGLLGPVVVRCLPTLALTPP